MRKKVKKVKIKKIGFIDQILILQKVLIVIKKKKLLKQDVYRLKMCFKICKI